MIAILNYCIIFGYIRYIFIFEATLEVLELRRSWQWCYGITEILLHVIRVLFVFARFVFAIFVMAIIPTICVLLFRLCLRL